MNIQGNFNIDDRKTGSSHSATEDIGIRFFLQSKLTYTNILAS